LRQCLATGLMVLAMLVLTVPGLAQAQDRTAAAATAAPDGRPALPSVDDLRKQLDAIPRKLPEDDDGRKLLDDATAIGTAADQIAARRTEELADIDSRLAGLGPAPDKGAPADAPDVAEQRASLARQRSAVDSELKLARLVSVDADQRGNDLIRQRREQFQAALTARTDSPLGRPFWRNLRTAAPLDAARLQGLGRELRQAVTSTMASERRGGFIASLAAALLIALLGPWLAERLLVRAAPARLPSGRLRRSLRAAATVLINTLLIGLAARSRPATASANRWTRWPRPVCRSRCSPPSWCRWARRCCRAGAVPGACPAYRTNWPSGSAPIRGGLPAGPHSPAWRRRSTPSSAPAWRPRSRCMRCRP
jgi:small-conductance mechanosensitive channel